MKKILPPDINDTDLAQALAENQSLSSHPHLRDNIELITQNYGHYVHHAGNPHQIQTININDILKNALQNHYSTPPQQLSFISNLRETGSPDVCPMCGSFSTGTLDHFLPKSDYPELAIFSKNLVPACNCNSKRKTVVKGENQNERILHPYFEFCFNQRILTCRFEGDLNNPNITLEICCGPIPERQAIEFHIETIVKRKNIIPWLEKKWAILKRRPKSVISTLPKNEIITEAIATAAINELLEDKDEEFETPNNWLSIFFHGLAQNTDAKEWVVNQHNGILEGTILPD